MSSTQESAQPDVLYWLCSRICLGSLWVPSLPAYSPTSGGSSRHSLSYLCLVRLPRLPLSSPPAVMSLKSNAPLNRPRLSRRPELLLNWEVYTMNRLMMQQPLLVSTLLTHAERHHGSQQIVSRRSRATCIATRIAN